MVSAGTSDSASHGGVSKGSDRERARRSSYRALRSVNVVRASVTAILAGMGVVLTHGLGYLMSHPEATARSEALAGHAHVHILGPGIVTAGAATAVLLVILGGRRRLLVRELQLSWRVLATSQLIGFVGLEVLERLNTLAEVVNEPALVAGVLLQVPAAWMMLRGITLGALLVGGIALMAAPPSWSVVAGPARLLGSRSGSVGTGPARHSPISSRAPPSRLV
jgi:hypothetical protein